MKPNRSIPPATVFPVLIYPDVRAAVAWLEKAFGFAERLQIGESHRSQLSVGDGAVIVGDVRHERRRRGRARRPTGAWCAWTTPAPIASAPGRTGRRS